MIILARSLHTTDSKSSSREATRKIANWSNFSAPPEGKPISDRMDAFRPAEVALAEITAKPVNWGDGGVDFAMQAVDAPLQGFVGGLKGEPMFGARRADRPKSWINWLALDGSDVSPGADDTGMTWRGIWPDADLRVEHCVHKLSKIITLHSPDAPSEYRFSAKVADGHTIELVGDSSVRIMDPSGTEVLHTNPVWAQDSATTDIMGGQFLRCTMVREKDRDGLAVFCLSVDQDDLRRAIFPVTIDPTTTISGTADVEDTLLRTDAVTLNYGGYFDIYHSTVHIPLVRVSTSALPTGAVTGFRFLIYYNAISGAQDPSPAYRLSLGATTWVEGTASGSAQIGSASYSHKVYNTVTWASGNFSSSDYVADASPPTVTPASGWKTYTLPNAWAQGWKAGTFANDGFVMTSPKYYAVWSATEHSNSGQRPYAEIDYVLGGAAAMLARRIHE
jgi:hypothetical protein